ncbi:MAG: alpha-ribazole phosphatase [Anaerolineales bacterium]|nr:alpha-ribazole phosphatase [Anaerolineales bacterium]
MKLLLTRHGETDFNLARRYQGQSDVPLNQTGIRQAAQIAKRLARENINAIYSSDLSRAADTAKWIADSQPQFSTLQMDSRWRELSFGDWEGCTHEEMNEGWHDLVMQWYADPANNSTPNGETLTQLAARVQSALDELQNKHKDETVLVVAHSGTIQALLCLALGVDLNRYWKFRVSQASLTVLNFYEDKAILNLFNDVSHLQET